MAFLDLSNNQAIRSLPPEIGQLGSLSTLILGMNRLTALPAEIGQLKFLTQFEFITRFLRL